MKVKLFYRTQRELSTDLNELIDAYCDARVDEEELIEGIQTIYAYNSDKLIKDKEFTKIVQQQSGKRRLAVVEKILQMG